jgi:CRISPR-associated endoribonuclease cas2
MSYRFMRSVLFFDLPTLNDKDKRVYRRFIKELKKLGFYMLQESVYVKMSIDRQMMDSTIQKIKSFSPTKGSIMILNVTEKQFSQLNIIIGENQTDIIQTDERVVII